jgi:hypothetical protein
MKTRRITGDPDDHLGIMDNLPIGQLPETRFDLGYCSKVGQLMNLCYIVMSAHLPLNVLHSVS